MILHPLPPSPFKRDTKRRYAPSVAELAELADLAQAAEKTPTPADEDREAGQTSREDGHLATEAPGATELPTPEDAEAVSSSVKGQSGRKRSRWNYVPGQTTGRQEEEGEEEADEEHKFSEWKVHPRWTPRKDTALQVTQ